MPSRFLNKAISVLEGKRFEKNAKTARQMEINKARIAQNRRKGTARDQSALNVVPRRDLTAPGATKMGIKKPNIIGKVGKGNVVNQSLVAVKTAVPPVKKLKPVVVKMEVEDSVQTKETSVVPQSNPEPEKATITVKVEKDLANDTKVQTQVTTMTTEVSGTTGTNKKAPTPDAAKEMPSDGYVELDSVRTRALEEELKNIKSQMWKALPDKPKTNVEQVAVDKFRCQIGDQFVNTLGLNVTKRLLNVFNPMLVKIKFSRRPESGCLTQLLQEYGVVRFQRLAGHTNTFAAQMRRVADFDRMCAATDVCCGSAKLTIVPCYNFTKCPLKLKTTFANHYDNKTKRTEQLTEDCERLNKESQVKEQETNTYKDVVVKKEKDSTHNSESDKQTAIKESQKDISKSKEQKNVATKTTVSSSEQQNVASLAEQQKVTTAATSIESTKAPDKVKKEPLKIITNVSSQESQKAKCTVIAQDQEKGTKAKGALSNTSDSSSLKELPKVTTSSPKEPKTTTTATLKEPQYNTITVQKDTNTVNLKEPQKATTVDSAKESSKVTATAKPKEAQKAANKVSPKQPQKAKTTAKDNVKTKNRELLEMEYFDSDDNEIILDECFDDDQLEDDEEMDDEDILALLAQGVVVDECTESEDEAR